MAENLLQSFDSFYFVGVGGMSMSALAKIVKNYGKRVGGCDRVAPSVDLGDIPVTVGVGDPTNYDCVVYTDAVAANDLTLLSARRMGKVIIPRGRFLAQLCQNYTFTVAVAGCHGKTTCTAILAHIFEAAGRNYTLHVGGEDATLGNARVRGSDYFITEACEYKKNFLAIKPSVAVVLNTDADHPDCYKDEAELKASYRAFALGAGEIVKLYGELSGVDATTFGFDDRADYYAKKMICNRGKYYFSLYERGVELGKIYLNVCGKHNVLNALAAIAVARFYGVEFADISEGIGCFSGVKRRFETIGYYNGARCIADYAHHPNEIKAALKTASQISEGDIFVVFQPHTYSRTKAYKKQFVGVLSPLKKLLIYRTYAAREYYDDAGSALTLSGKIKRSVYGEKPEDIACFLSAVRKGDTVLFLGAGNIYDIATDLVNG